MRVKAFSLMELIVVVLLLGTMFSLVLSTFKFKTSILKNQNIKDLPQYIQQKGLLEDAVFYIYGDQCDKSSLITNNATYKNDAKFTFKKSYKIYNMDNMGILKIYNFQAAVIDKKQRHICFRLNFNRGKFTDKFIVYTGAKYLLFAPMYQEVKTFDNLEKAKKTYFRTDMIPKSADDYYQQ